MNYYERYLRLINDKIASSELTEDFIETTTERLAYYLKKKKITNTQYDELIKLMNVND